MKTKPNFPSAMHKHGLHLRGLIAAVAVLTLLQPANAFARTEVAQVPPPLGDFGDAPDSGSNHASIATNTAYTDGSVPGRFPSVWDGTPAFGAAGPYHRDSGVVLLGGAVSEERDADLAPDPDGQLNILNGGNDNANNDSGDDGWRNPLRRLPNCQSVRLKVRITRNGQPQLPTPGLMYLNAWIDGNRDGDWGDTGTCPAIPADFDDIIAPRLITATPFVVNSYEWMVQNQPINVFAVPQGGFLDYDIFTDRILNTTANQPHWIRFTLSGRPAITPSIFIAGTTPLPDGRGPNPPNYFFYGETEDYKVQERAEEPQPGPLAITKTVLTQANPSGGDGAIYTINLSHVGGAAPAETMLRDRLPAGVHFVGPISVTAVGGSVSPTSASFVSGTVAWQGAIDPNTTLRLRFPVRINPCVGASKTITNVARAQNTDGTIIADNAVFTVNCDPPPNVEVIKRVIVPSHETHQPVTEAHVLPGEEVIYRFVMRNQGSDTATVYLRDQLPDGVVFTNGDPQELKVTLTAGAGLTASVDMPARVLERCIFGKVITNVAEYKALPGMYDAESGVRPPASVPISYTNAVKLNLHCDDLGDAPDSTNHPNIAMSAYPAVQANFPTVFDPATGADQGPRHRVPNPFHLGPRFSSEADADLLPDEDGRRNLVPAANDANRDGEDDGVLLSKVAFSDCATTTLPVKVFIGPNAAAFFAEFGAGGTGYLNVWVDGNRDGDWADVRQCGGADGNRPAFEHIVIDYPVSLAALGAGLHTLNATTGLVPWAVAQANSPAWLRFTLSERPANKNLTLGARLYGDGRGHTLAFATGETEDYLWKPVLEADVAIHKRGAMRTESGAPITGTASTSDHVFWLINYKNIGSVSATNVVITDDLGPPAGSRATFEITSVPPLSYTLNGNEVRFDVGTLAAGASGQIIIELARRANERTYTNTVAISATNDVDASNNSDTASVNHNFLQPPVILNPLNATTCDGTYDANEIFGYSTPGATVDIYIDGVLEYTDDVEGGGYFHLGKAITLTDGVHTLYAVARTANHEAVGAERVLIVNSALSWDPMSVRFTSPLGAHYVPRDADGRTDETGWQLHLLANTTYTVSVRVCCESPLASVTLDVGGTALTLTDPDGDGKYEAPYTTPATGISALVLTMMVTCDGATSESVSEALIDPDGVVTDIKTGATLSDANVVCLVQGAGSAPNATYSVWPADSFGQINPQKTKADGYFAFFTPAGIYRLDVSRSGYQPYSSPDLNVVATPVRHDVALTPLIAQTANQTVTIEATGFNPVSITIPMGGVVKWLNADAKSHAIKGTTGAGIDSGMLAPGASYTWQATQAGQFSVFDTASERSMVVHVMDGVDAQFKVLLPLVRK